MKRSVAVTIAGQSYALKSDAEEAYVQALASFVDDKITVVSRRRTLLPGQAAILAAMQIADELFRERDRRATLKKRVKSRTLTLLEEIDAMASQSAAAHEVKP